MSDWSLEKSKDIWSQIYFKNFTWNIALKQKYDYTHVPSTFEKLFDTVIHEGIKIKLLEIGVGYKFYNRIKIVCNCNEQIMYKGRQSSHWKFPIQLGVKQGDSLNRSLFKIFINNLSDAVRWQIPSLFNVCRWYSLIVQIFNISTTET